MTEASFPLLLVALAVWYLEHLRRTAADQPGSAAQGFFQMLRRFMPEFVCLGALAVFAVSALVRGGNNNDIAMQQESDHKLWEHMQNQWGLLRTPDTFVALQAMLRVALLAAAIFRGAEADASPLMGESIHLFFMAAAGRMAMLFLAPVGSYALDGPLGGDTFLAFEGLSCGLLAYLSGRAFWKRLGRDYAPVFVILLAIAGWVAWTNHLGLAGPELKHLDVLNSFSELVELLAAFAFFIRTVRCAAGSTLESFGSFVHLVLPLQQLLPVSFHLMAWETKPLEEHPDLIGAGHPLIVLQLAGAAQVGLYLLAATWHFTSLGAAVKEVCEPFVVV